MTPTLTPFLAAQIFTNKGCVETGQNPVFDVGEVVRIFYGAGSSPEITQAQMTIIDFPAGSQGVVILIATRQTNTTFFIDATISPPTGTETVVIQAQGGGLSSQSQCSFQVTQPSGCMTACDCPTEQRCNMTGTCENGPVPVYCCEGAICPSMAVCQHMAGGFSNCP